MAHRLLHSLVISSLFALEGSGCTSSHDRPPLPPPPPDGDDAGTSWLDAGEPRPRDAGVRRSDAGRSPSDAGSDAGAPDAAAPTDAGLPSDAGLLADGGELPMCEPGWPTTKGFFCTELENGEIVCCDSLLLPDGGQRCCVPESE